MVVVKVFKVGSMLGEYLAQLLTNLIPIYQLKWQSVPAFAKVTAQNLAF